jgi:hypothetical protein
MHACLLLTSASCGVRPDAAHLAHAVGQGDGLVAVHIDAGGLQVERELACSRRCHVCTQQQSRQVTAPAPHAGLPWPAPRGCPGSKRVQFGAALPPPHNTP